METLQQNTIGLLEQHKRNVARICFFGNLILGILALPLWMFATGFVCSLVGYGFLWMYWLEMQLTNKFSSARWIASFVFNAFGVVVYLLWATAVFGHRGVFLIFWTIVMALISLVAAWLSSRVDRSELNEFN